MKPLIPRVLTSLLAFVLLTAAGAFGQSVTVIKVSIPFEFAVGDKIFPAGDYSVTQPLQHVLALRDARGQTIASTVATGVELQSPAEISKLRFRSVDGRNVLSEIWQQDSTTGLRLRVVHGNHRSYVAQRRSLDSREAAEGSQP